MTKMNLTAEKKAQTKELISSRVWRGGTREEYEEFLEAKEFEGNDTVYFWAEPVKVKGNNGGSLWHWDMSEAEDHKLVVWSDDLARPTVWQKVGEYEEQGILLWKYELSASEWQNSTENADNAKYFQQVHGLFNVTPVVGAFRSFLSRPHYYDVGSQVKEDVTGLDDSNSYYEKWWFAVEPNSGITMAKLTIPQLCFEVTSLRELYDISAATVPVVWFDSYAYIGEEDANLFKGFVYGLEAGAIVLFVAGVSIGLILLVVGNVLLYQFRPSKFIFDMEMKTTSN